MNETQRAILALLNEVKSMDEEMVSTDYLISSLEAILDPPENVHLIFQRKN